MNAAVKAGASAAATNAADQGFTLVELLIALTLLGLVLALMSGGFRFGISAWESGDHRIAQSNEIGAVQNLLRNEIGQARALPVNSRMSTLKETFKGSPTELEFAAPLPAHMGPGGYYLFSLHAGEVRDRLGLVLAWRAYRPDMFAAGRDKHGEEAVLLDDIRRIAFAYYGQSDADQVPVWTDNWGDRRGLPKLVRIRVELPPGERQDWPEFDVELKSSVSLEP
jgi:general secretion pathway protein J